MGTDHFMKNIMTGVLSHRNHRASTKRDRSKSFRESNNEKIQFMFYSTTLLHTYDIMYINLLHIAY